MSATKIEWATDTWNPITGCTPISEGCAHCYAKRMAEGRLKGRFGYPADDPFRPGTLHRDKLDEPLKWKKPCRVFACSMGDLFHDDVGTDDIDRVFAVMRRCPQHVFMVLTKRPARMHAYIKGISEPTAQYIPYGFWPLPNVWLGVTAENQARADERIPVLLQIPAAVRFVSIEPMLGPVDLTREYDGLDPGGMHYTIERIERGIDWVICGGETGPGARPMPEEWAVSLRDQCRAAGVPFFMKKMSGGLQPPGHLMVRELPPQANAGELY